MIAFWISLHCPSLKPWDWAETADEAAKATTAADKRDIKYFFIVMIVSMAVFLPSYIVPQKYEIFYTFAEVFSSKD